MIPASADELSDWHDRPGALERLLPPWEPVQIVDVQGRLSTGGQRVVFRLVVGGILPLRWEAEASGYKRGQGFVDVQLHGPFTSWKHIHRFVPRTEEQSLLQDEVSFRLPGGSLVHALAEHTVWNRLDRLFRYRHHVIATDLRRHRQFRHHPRQRIVISGSRGLIGSALVPFLTTGGHEVIRLVSRPATPPYDDGTLWQVWPEGESPPGDLLAQANAVIHLAGENIATGRWNVKKKQRIADSRVLPTRRLAESLAALSPIQRPQTLLCASAVGFYGHRGEEELSEQASPGSGFFPEVCQQWEAATEPARQAGIRTVYLRFGAVLSPRGGALAKQLPPFRLGLGSVLGNGEQWIPWISISDAIAAIYHCLMNSSIQGPVNVVAPQPVQQRTFAKTLGRVLRRPACLWLPAPVLRSLFGELADHALLVSTRALPEKLLATGFTFEFPELEGALRFLLGR
jgi:uncharacterized protein (TIGR01777 family)